MTTTFLRIRLADGTQVISEFRKLRGSGRYIANALAGRVPLNIWQYGRGTLPTNERITTRTRRVIQATDVREVEIVARNASAPVDSYDPIHFALAGDVVYDGPEPHQWTCPDVSPRPDLVPGLAYPIHRDSSLRRYVVVRASASDGSEEVSYYIDPQGPGDGDDLHTSPVTGATDPIQDDEDRDDDWNGDED